MNPNNKRKPRISKPQVSSHEIENRVKLFHGNNISIDITNYTGVKNKCGFICASHGPFSSTPQAVLRVNNGKKSVGCSKCANDIRKQNLNKFDPDYLINILNESPYSEEYIWIENYTGDNKRPHSIMHKICGSTFSLRPNDFQQGKICKCSLVLYFVHLKNDSEQFVKIGIKSNKRTFRTDHIVTDICSFTLVSKTARNIEKMVKEKFSNKRFTPSEEFDGSLTECFDIDELSNIKALILNEINK